MNKKHKLAAFLHLLSSILFWFFIVFLTFDTALNLFFENSEIKTGENSKIANSKGYAIPMKVSLNLKKEGYIYKKGGTSVQVFNDEKLNESFLYNETFTKEFIKEIKSSYDERQKTGSNFILTDPTQQGNFDFTNRTIDSKTRIIVKPKTTFLTIMLFLDNYHSILITILILYFLKQIFYHLKKDLSFNMEVSKNVKRIGFLLILTEVLGAIFNLIIGTYISHVSIETDILFRNAFNINFNPTIEFDLPMFITGLSLLVVSILLNKGNDLQTESNLTI
ncbi:DUF2975 domain-containing protein [Tenacibaculum sp. 190524A05c]|uniref:DUF2975 domain-containing protein n=1 Tax=Tenacibaculum platacis TaxID=3137852 RepID=UPI0031FB18FC